ncbi:hypothetical protein NMY22_g12598 [Coprinellus aureogranulatus]|nr:hypothetical protein NMY22_g12598 [Coprinellus aureogranulatus]
MGLNFLSSLVVLALTASLIPFTMAQSPTPSCYICPSADIVDFPLSNSNYGVDPFVCEFGATIWFCAYSPVST